MVLAEPVQITQQIAQGFDRLNIRYFVGGSLASSLHGVPRATQDVDIVADIKMARRKQYQISDTPRQMLFLASAEDIIIHKLYWFQLGGGVSERQWNDVSGVIRVQYGKLDNSYLEHAAHQRGVTALLQKAIKEAEGE
jgi:hypothetical protein